MPRKRRNHKSWKTTMIGAALGVIYIVLIGFALAKKITWTELGIAMGLIAPAFLSLLSMWTKDYDVTNAVPPEKEEPRTLRGNIKSRIEPSAVKINDTNTK